MNDSAVHAAVQHHRGNTSIISRWGPLLAVTAAILTLGTRMFFVIWKYAVNVLYMDQWDYLLPFFIHETSFVRLFFWEHGPHREGVALLPAKFIYRYTLWNSRVDCFIIGAIIFSAMLLTLRLKIRLYGPLSYSDIAIPVIFLTMALEETLLLVPNPAPMAAPLLLTIIYCLALLSRNRLVRYALVLFVNYVMINTGYAIFMAVITICLFVLESYWSWRRLTQVPVYYPLVGLILSVASLGSFFINYVFQPASDCFLIPHSTWLKYPQFMSLMLSGYFVPRPLTPSLHLALIGGVALVAILVIFGIHLFHLVKSPLPETHLVGAVLLGFSLLFVINAAVARQCLGPEQALVSRYTPLLIPAFVAIYFYLLSRPWLGLRNFVIAAFILLLLPSALILPREEVLWYNNGKKHWAECYRRTGDLNYCDKVTNFKIYPDAEHNHLQQKLDYLKENRLNLFAETKSK